MPQAPQKLNAAQPITEADKTMSQLFRAWAISVSNNIPTVGTGSPEGVIELPQYSLYIDETVPASPVQYRKMIPSISGDRSQGWVVV